MISFRRAVGGIVVAWLVSQAATLTIVPVALMASLAGCRCPHPTDATCPMHLKTRPGSKVCAVQNATSSATASLNSLFGVVGLVPPPARNASSVPMGRSANVEASTTPQRHSPPDPPPPRA